MKKQISFFVLSLMMFAASALAADNFTAEPVLMQNEKAAAGDVFAIVTGSGQVISKPGAIFTQGGDYKGMELPYLISNPKPIVYPRWAVRQGWTGQLELAIEIFENGRVGKYKVMKSTGHEMLDKAAIKSVQTWKFHPAMKNGKAIHTCVQIPILFDLQSE